MKPTVGVTEIRFYREVECNQLLTTPEIIHYTKLEDCFWLIEDNYMCEYVCNCSRT